MKGLKVSQAAEKLGLSKVSIHKWVKRLTLIENGLAFKENGAVLLTDEALRLIEENHKSWMPDPEPVGAEAAVNQVVTPAVNPPENPCKVNDSLYERLTDRFGEEVKFLREQLSKRDETIQQLIIRQTEERQRTDTIIMKLAHDLEDTRRSALAIESKVNALLPKPDSIDLEALNRPAPKVKPWTPPAKVSDPLEGAGLLTRAWVYLLEPEKLRRFAS